MKTADRTGTAVPSIPAWPMPRSGAPARCRAARHLPLHPDERVLVTGMAPEQECDHEMFVESHWRDGSLAVPSA